MQEKKKRFLAYSVWALFVVAAGCRPPEAETVTEGVLPIERVSKASTGVEGDGYSESPSISADGRYVAFHSYAKNLVPGDSNGLVDVFVYDRQSGVIERVSVDSSGTQGNGRSVCPAISADGRYVAFESYATNLAPLDINGFPDIFVYDRQADKIELVSVDATGAGGDGESRSPAISADGRYVAFDSIATNLVSSDTNGMDDVFVYDRQFDTIERVSVDATGIQGDRESFHATISADGRYVAFESGATNLVPGDADEFDDIFVHDRQTGAIELVSVGGTQANGVSYSPAISANGRYVAFVSGATNLVPGDTNNFPDEFVFDRQTDTIERVSFDMTGTQANNNSWDPAISADGRYVAFFSRASNLVSSDINNTDDAFVYDRQTDIIVLVSVDAVGAQGNGISVYPAISADGRYVAFMSDATNLAPGDTNGVTDVFVAPAQ